MNVYFNALNYIGLVNIQALELLIFITFGINLSFQLSVNDGLPQYVCTQCVKKINELRDFINSCHRTQKQLLQLFPTSG